jgi:hypothetical protein
MSRSDDNLPFDVEGIADRLRADRPRPSDETLDATRNRVMGRMKSHQGAAMTARTKMVALVTGGLLLTTAAATAATQTNNQSSTTNQSITQSSGGGVVIGGGNQTATNSSDTNISNCQVIGGFGSASCATYAAPTADVVGLSLGAQSLSRTGARGKARTRKARRGSGISRIIVLNR